MITSSETLAVVNSILKDLETEVIKETNNLTEIRVVSSERSTTRQDVEKLLSVKKINFGELTRNVGSFGGTEIISSDKKIRLIYKLSGSRGSGGGAEATRLTESAQCVYSAIAFGLGRKITSNDVTPENVKKFSKRFNVDEKVENILNKLPDEWVQSSILGANKLVDKFKGDNGTYVFHRGSKIVDRIENSFKRVKKNENVRMDINKWNPADIWMVSNKFSFDALDKQKTILGLNQVIQKKLEDKVLVGVSLKKIVGNAKISLKNAFKDMKTNKSYKGFEYGKTSKDGYLLMNGGTKIQYRTFGGDASLTGFQGEVKGSQANQGKISLGPTNMILRNHGVGTVPTDAAARVKKNPGLVFQEISLGLKKYAKMSSIDIKKLEMNSKIITPSWLYSKLQVTQLFNIITMLKRAKQDEIVEDLYLYASSQSKYSSAYYKLE